MTALSDRSAGRDEPRPAPGRRDEPVASPSGGTSRTLGPRRTGQARPRASVWSQRSLIWNFAQRDLKSRFKGTILGWAWALVVPLATLATYTLVFSVIFRTAPPDFGSGRAGNFTVWLMAGLVPWSFFLISINIAIPTLLANGSLLQKIYFPAFVPVVGATIAILVQTLIEFMILAAVLVILGNVGPTWLLFPVWLGLFVLFVNGLAISLAILNVHARDLAHITSVVLQLLFFLTPIIYPTTVVPESWNGIPLRAFVEANPLSQFVEALRTLAYGLAVPDPARGLILIAWTVGSVSLAAFVYRRRGQDIGETI